MLLRKFGASLPRADLRPSRDAHSHAHSLFLAHVKKFDFLDLSLCCFRAWALFLEQGLRSLHGTVLLGDTRSSLLAEQLVALLLTEGFAAREQTRIRSLASTRAWVDQTNLGQFVFERQGFSF